MRFSFFGFFANEQVGMNIRAVLEWKKRNTGQNTDQNFSNYKDGETDCQRLGLCAAEKASSIGESVPLSWELSTCLQTLFPETV